MLNEVLPGIEKLARELQPETFKILKAGQEGKVELTKRKIAQILANGFFCNFKDATNIPQINFERYDSVFCVLLCSLSVINNSCANYFEDYTVRTEVTNKGANQRGKS
jgi:hypothetical protein